MLFRWCMPKKINIPIDVVARHFHLPIDDAAQVLGACVTVLKKTCRKYGIKRWPHQRLRYIDRRIRQYSTKAALDAPGRDELERLKQQRTELLNGLQVDLIVDAYGFAQLSAHNSRPVSPFGGQRAGIYDSSGGTTAAPYPLDPTAAPSGSLTMGPSMMLPAFSGFPSTMPSGASTPRGEMSVPVGHKVDHQLALFTGAQQAVPPLFSPVQRQQIALQQHQLLLERSLSGLAGRAAVGYGPALTSNPVTPAAAAAQLASFSSPPQVARILPGLRQPSGPLPPGGAAPGAGMALPVGGSLSEPELQGMVQSFFSFGAQVGGHSPHTVQRALPAGPPAPAEVASMGSLGTWTSGPVVAP